MSATLKRNGPCDDGKDHILRWSHLHRKRVCMRCHFVMEDDP